EGLEEAVNELDQRYTDTVPRPPQWGGFRISPTTFEFWQGRPSRMHDRVLYRLADGRWERTRLSP
ncbi:MAG: pyridoxamine 5'-phosphate oxidase, partial [Acidimicrobiia bacterium]|nr:pyridoxamine 5'-phosphate oxidase [Acidimicrobiia bacterium]